MITLTSTRKIDAPGRRVFDMVRSVDVHQAAVPVIRARIEKGRKQGLLELNEQILWSAIYFGIRFRITMTVSACDPPFHYNETNSSGPFRVFKHTYTFTDLGDHQTLLSDELELESGFGFIGRWIDCVFLAPAFRKALEVRMDHLKLWSEEGAWRRWISEKDQPAITGVREQ